MSIPVIQHLRLTYIWTETTLQLVRDPAPQAPFAFLGRDSSYITRFDGLQQGQNDPDGLTLPWPKPSGQRFWTYYLNRRPGDVKGGKAWEDLVPMRLKLDVSLSASWLPGKAIAEGYFYPYGHALAVTFDVAPTSLSLDAAVDLARDLRKRRKLVVQWSPTRSEELILDAFADSARTLVRELALGKGAEPGAAASSPFSIVTFVRMEGVDPAEPLAEGGEVHRALEVVTGWDATPPPQVPPLKESVLDSKSMPNVVYARKRGRTVWFPNAATNVGVKTLTCYSRNLAYASLQVESLARLVSETAESGFLSDTHRDLARYAAGLLGRIYGGNEKTYKSTSCRVQLEQNSWLDSIDEIRTRFPSMGKLQRLVTPAKPATSTTG